MNNSGACFESTSYILFHVLPFLVAHKSPPSFQETMECTASLHTLTMMGTPFILISFLYNSRDSTKYSCFTQFANKISFLLTTSCFIRSFIPSVMHYVQSAGI
ncbi:unnamed protein product [Calicophoron daubneyi]|uniref:Uncharacterized protein n=1 Tax=Calicophoron daubneyi TaxID=300641 RepID=A0AAV2T0I8_CALDB